MAVVELNDTALAVVAVVEPSISQAVVAVADMLRCNLAVVAVVERSTRPRRLNVFAPSRPRIICFTQIIFIRIAIYQRRLHQHPLHQHHIFDA